MRTGCKPISVTSTLNISPYLFFNVDIVFFFILVQYPLLMRILWLFVFGAFFVKSAFGALSPAIYKDITPDSVDKLNIAATNIYLADPVYGRKLASDALLASKAIGYKRGIGQSSLNIGITYWSQSYYSISQLYIDTALRYFDKNDRLLISDCYRYIGRDYIDLKDYRSAEYFLNKAQETAGNDKKRAEQILSERSYLFLRLKRFEEAYKTACEALTISFELGDIGERAVIYSRFPAIYMAKGQYGKALNYCDTAFRLTFTVNNKRLQAFTYSTRSSLLLLQNKPAEALKYARMGLALGDSLGVMDIVGNAYKAMIGAFMTLGDKEKLISYQSEYTAFLEKRIMLNRQSSSLLIRDHFELNNKLQDIDRVKQRSIEDDLNIRAQKQTITILAFSLILLITALYIVSFYYKQKNLLAKRLRDQNVEILARSQVIKKQAHDVEELNDFKSKLLAIIGHDLRSPINNLRNAIDLFEDGSFTADDVQILMKNISPVVRGAELTLSNLLVWADGQIRGIKNIQTTSVALYPIIDEVKEINKASLGKKSIHIQNNTGLNDHVLADENHLKVILSNLISNAIKFTGNNGTITIATRHEDKKLVISVCDTGIGMGPEEVEKLLSANTHFSKRGTEGETGTGIGLLLCRELIEINGGKLWVTSKLNEGTTFYFSMPTASES